MTWTHIRGANVQFYLENMGITPENPVFSWRGRREILACMHELRPLVQDTSKSQRVTAFTQSMCGHRLFSLLAAACDEQQADSHALPQQEKYVRQAMRFIDNSVDVITIQDVAAHVGLHRSYLSTLFHRYTGKSPQEYLIDHRMKRACALFANPFSTTSNVAYSLGYDPSTFCRVFRQVTGMTPMQYKASLRKKL